MLIQKVTKKSAMKIELNTAENSQKQKNEGIRRISPRILVYDKSCFYLGDSKK